MAEDFGSLVRDKWSSLLAEGFKLVQEVPRVLNLNSETLTVRVGFDPRGELDVTAYLRGTDPRHGWMYTGIVGRASFGRLLEIALSEMRANPAILSADADFYADVERQSRARAAAWTAFYAGQGPRPGRHLP